MEDQHSNGRHHDEQERFDHELSTGNIPLVTRYKVASDVFTLNLFKNIVHRI